jgi:hypothetical protein
MGCSSWKLAKLAAPCARGRARTHEGVASVGFGCGGFIPQDKSQDGGCRKVLLGRPERALGICLHGVPIVYCVAGERASFNIRWSCCARIVPMIRTSSAVHHGTLADRTPRRRIAGESRSSHISQGKRHEEVSSCNCIRHRCRSYGFTGRRWRNYRAAADGERSLSAE